MSNVVYLFSKKKTQDYEEKLSKLSKVQLLEEMVVFQEERKKLDGKLTHEMMLRGIPLFKALENAADSQELRILSRSYLRHLEYEIANSVQM